MSYENVEHILSVIIVLLGLGKQILFYLVNVEMITRNFDNKRMSMDKNYFSVE